MIRMVLRLLLVRLLGVRAAAILSILGIVLARRRRDRPEGARRLRGGGSDAPG